MVEPRMEHDWVDALGSDASEVTPKPKSFSLGHIFIALQENGAPNV